MALIINRVVTDSSSFSTKISQDRVIKPSLEEGKQRPNIEILTCQFCKNIPVPGLTASQCKECQKISCTDCLDNWFKTNKNCKFCGVQSQGNGISELSEMNAKNLKALRIYCKNKHLKCNQELILDKDLIQAHESDCIQVCKLCNQKVLKVNLTNHQTNTSECQSFPLLYSQQNTSQKGTSPSGKELNNGSPIIQKSPTNIRSTNILHQDSGKESQMVVEGSQDIIETKKSLLADEQRTLQWKNELQLKKQKEKEESVRRLKERLVQADTQIWYFSNLLWIMIFSMVIYTLINVFGGYDQVKECGLTQLRGAQEYVNEFFANTTVLGFSKEQQQ